MTPSSIPPGFQDLLSFKFLDALLGRRSRRFFMGAEIPDGLFAYKSPQAPVPLSELEKLLVVAAFGGNTSWHHLIYRAQRALQAQYIYDTFGKFPGTVPSIFLITYLQAHHLDLEFYDHFYKPGANLKSHAEHMERWHSAGAR